MSQWTLNYLTENEPLLCLLMVYMCVCMCVCILEEQEGSRRKFVYAELFTNIDDYFESQSEKNTQIFIMTLCKKNKNQTHQLKLTKTIIYIYLD